MKKLCYTVALFALVLTQGYSQKTLLNDYAYKVGESYLGFEAKERKYFAKGNAVLALKLIGREALIQKFNSDKPEFIKEKKHEKYFPKNSSPEATLEINGRYYCFYFSWEDNSKEQLFAIEIDFETGEFIGVPKSILQIDGKLTGIDDDSNGVFFTDAKKFDFIPSHDKKNVLIKYRKRPKIKRDAKNFDVIGLFVFDGDLNKVSGNEITMPYTESRMDNLDCQIDNKGNLYLLAKIFNDDSGDEKKWVTDSIASYHVELMTIRKGSEKIEISKFDNKEKFISKLWIFDTDQDFLVCAGFYSNGKNNFEDSDGILAFKIKEDGTIYDYFFNEIPLEILNQYESGSIIRQNGRRERNNDNAQFSDLELTDLVVNHDGSIVIIGEQHFSVEHKAYNNVMTTPYITYHYNDMLVSKINADATLGWMRRIPKKQIGLMKLGGMSFKYLNINNNHYFVYLDNIKNINLPLDKQPARQNDGEGGYLTAVKIFDADGALTKGSILNSRDVEDFKIYQFSTNRIVKTSESSFLLEVYKKKKEDIMIKVDLK